MKNAAYTIWKAGHHMWEPKEIYPPTLCQIACNSGCDAAAVITWNWITWGFLAPLVFNMF